jgi:Uncharacterized protein conserved in bacteria
MVTVHNTTNSLALSIKKLMELFAGYDKAYGTYDATGMIYNDMKGGKQEIKSSATTLRQPVTLKLWTDHVAGSFPLGIIPIRLNNTCTWGCIDIDAYDISLTEIYKQVEKLGLPLTICRSKSGGAHLFLFCTEPIEARAMQDTLKVMAALIGHGSAEIFPKQRAVNWERSDLGSWLNMPYFAGDNTDRYAINAEGEKLLLDEFLAVAMLRIKSPSEIINFEQIRKRGGGDNRKGDSEFGDGPPCMQHLASVGYPDGMRNKGLFALAVFAKKKYGLRWVEMIEKWNRDLFDPPLDSKEVVAIVQNHEKKDYNYTCKEHPLLAHCNSSVCRGRKYGVGGDDEYPVISGMSCLKTDPPLWFLDVGDERIELSTEDLQNYKSFHKICMEQLRVCYRMIKQTDWITMVGVAMRNSTEIIVSKEVGLSGQFEEILEEFLTHRNRGESKDDLLQGRPWEDTDLERHYFRLKDLQKFLEGSGFKVYNRARIASRLRALGGDADFFKIKKKGTNVWWVPANFDPMPPSRPKKFDGDPI